MDAKILFLSRFIKKNFIERVVDALNRDDLEQENDRLNRFNKLLRAKISQLEEKIGQMGQGKLVIAKDDDTAEAYKSVCHAVAHNLKGGFFHIGSSVDEIRELTGGRRRMRYDRAKHRICGPCLAETDGLY